ncbi:hypothetical protein FD754_014220 [Muntiacus muntjak]|uniref:protein-serine/threonine phosphatase n=1 Tax=Muntiacus muntjak TaxID=9888 RepID=A0A5N3VK01_MUNMU|nr:hypothetical protein FD754_014220 [Muntiacus muntjak]
MRGSKLCKDVWLQENEKKELCLKFHQIFLSQPILLELEALLKIVVYSGGCGLWRLSAFYWLKKKKIDSPETFFLLTRNHKCASINRMYGFCDECKRYNVTLCFTDCFICLPVAAFTFLDKKILCCSGGLSPDLQSVEQIWKNM